eukprot:508015-Pleurochrysis_carterae.AAC.1
MTANHHRLHRVTEGLYTDAHKALSNAGANARLEGSSESGDSGRSAGQRRSCPLACVRRSDRD